LKPPGGIVQGARLETTVTLARGARSVLTTQSATKVYRTDQGLAEELTRYTVEGDAVLECLPDHTIPFGGSRLFRSTLVEADPHATVILTDALAAGRVARAERFQFDHLFLETEVRVGGEQRMVDRVDLDLRGGGFHRLGLWDRYVYCASLYAYSPRVDAALAAELAALLEGRERVYAGAGQPGPNCVMARILGSTADDIRRLLFDAWDLLRRPLLGKPARPLRKF
jgi:urease accessory protein